MRHIHFLMDYPLSHQSVRLQKYGFPSRGLFLRQSASIWPSPHAYKGLATYFIVIATWHPHVVLNLWSLASSESHMREHSTILLYSDFVNHFLWFRFIAAAQTGILSSITMSVPIRDLVELGSRTYFSLTC